MSDISSLTQPIPVQKSQPVPSSCRARTRLWNKCKEAVAKGAASSHSIIDCPKCFKMHSKSHGLLQGRAATGWARDELSIRLGNWHRSLNNTATWQRHGLPWQHTVTCLTQLSNVYPLFPESLLAETQKKIADAFDIFDHESNKTVDVRYAIFFRPVKQ